MELQSRVLDLSDCERIADAVRVRIYQSQDRGHISKGVNEGRRRMLFSLRTLYEVKNAPWRRYARGSEGRTIPGACCYHGHYAFMDAILDADPDARIITSRMAGRTVYDGRAGFTEHAGPVAQVRVGWDRTNDRPLTFVDTCKCVQPMSERERRQERARLARTR